ncbi:hypothetical protein QF038_001977 [Pseudarthrobacter sp. W1I19]|nr:hypothetical protein [Pseudarthrobacter sp. W1I19]
MASSSISRSRPGRWTSDRASIPPSTYQIAPLQNRGCRKPGHLLDLDIRHPVGSQQHRARTQGHCRSGCFPTSQRLQDSSVPVTQFQCPCPINHGSSLTNTQTQRNQRHATLGRGRRRQCNVDGGLDGVAVLIVQLDKKRQGTVYQATAYAVPFIAAVAAGEVPDGLRVPLVALLGDTAIGGSCKASSRVSCGLVRRPRRRPRHGIALPRRWNDCLRSERPGLRRWSTLFSE